MIALNRKGFLLTVGVMASSLLAVFGEEDWSRIYLASNARLLPDASQLVFEWNDALWMAPAAGGEARRIMTGYESDDTWPAVSPDGKKIAFVSRRDGNFNVWTFNRETGEIKNVVRHSETTIPRQWSSDGKTIVCTAARDNASTLRCSRIILADAEGVKPEFMPFDAEGDDPALSPDMKTILFTWRGELPYRKRAHSTTSQAGEIWAYNLDTGSFTRVVNSKYGARDPIWAPDGKGFYYLGPDGELPFRNVRYHDMATGEDRRITSFTDEHVFQITISADGKTMVVREAFDFWSFDPTAANVVPKKLTFYPEKGYRTRPEIKRRHYESAWCNDNPGDVCFTDNGMQTAFTAGGDLWVMETQLRKPQLVRGDTRTHERECMFTPDGKLLYYLSDRGDGSDVCVAERDDPSKAWWENTRFVHRRLTSDDTPKSGFSISPDGRRMAWVDDTGKLAFADLQGNIVGRGPDVCGAGAYAWSPDAKWVAAAIGDKYGNFDIWIVPTEPGPQGPYNLSRNFKRDDWPAWSPDGKIIAFVGERADASDQTRIFYVYLNPEDEAREANSTVENARSTVRNYAASPSSISEEANDEVDEGYKIVFDGLYERVRRVEVRAEMPFFRWDSRTLAFNVSGKTETIVIPSRLKPQSHCQKVGGNPRWLERDDRIVWAIDGLPAHGENTFAFKVFQETDLKDYQELGFRTAWARIRDRFYDPNYHGADWEAIKTKLLPAARNARSNSVYGRVLRWMLGELDASHLGFNPSDSSNKMWIEENRYNSWRAQTAHVGLRFMPEAGGWRIVEVLKDGPAEKSAVGFKVGDMVTAIDSVRVNNATVAADVLRGQGERRISVTWVPCGGTERTDLIDCQTWEQARQQKAAGDLAALRRHVHEKSSGKIGYLHIPQMDWASYLKFQDELFSEGFGKDGLIIDVRDNLGGFTADRILSLLCTPDHATFDSRGMLEPAYLIGYWGKPVFSGKVAVLCNERTISNGEIFSHAIKHTKRGVLIGRPTAGEVIATSDRPLLDLGTFRDAFRGCYTADGTDMENNPAIPDIYVEDTPADRAAGLDVQLDTAIDTLLKM